MAVAVEVAAIGSATGTTSASAGPITPAGSNRFVIGFGGQAAGSLSGYSDMTFGGNQMTPQVNVTNSPYLRGVAEDLVAPAASSQSLVYTVSATQDDITAAVIALSGADQATPTGAYQNSTVDTGDPVSIAVTVASGEIGIGFCVAACLTIASGQTTEAEVEAIAGEMSASLASVNGAASAMTWTRGSIAFNDTVAIAVAVKPSSGGGGGLPFFMQNDILHGQIQQVSGGYQ